MIVVVEIHNNSLGKCVQVNTIDDATDTVKQWFEDRFRRPLSDDENFELENNYEVHWDDDSDNVFTISIGIIE